MSARLSIRRRLLAMLISTILLVWLVVLVLVYRAAQHEVEEVFDADMARSAHILQTLLLHEVEEEAEMAENVREVAAELGEQGSRDYPRLAEILAEYANEGGREKLELASAVGELDHKYGNGLAFVARYADGSIMLRDTAAPDMPSTADGYANLQIGDDTWRVYSLTDAATAFSVQVGERMAYRDELVRYITRNTLTPALVAVPILAILIWFVVGHALAPLQRVAGEVARRAPEALEPIDGGGTPTEINSLVDALNKLFGRVSAAIQRERQFTADAAHELRTPLAALKTHLQVARKGTAEPATRDALAAALQGVDRATHSVEQLLLLARADAALTRAIVNATVDLRDVAAQTVAALSQQALDHDIDLGLEGEHRVMVGGDAVALQTLLRNLIDNAVRYTPAGGTVTVAVGAGGDGAWMAVLDDGPGVGADDRGKIFNRFHRGSNAQADGVQGSGLGLSIVRRIADLHAARIEVGEGLNGRGLGVRLVFPPPEPA